MKFVSTLIIVAFFAVEIVAAQDRGFGLGQTLPDISLINLEGEEVRFSDFLGSQYVLYGWASW